MSDYRRVLGRLAVAVSILCASLVLPISPASAAGAGSISGQLVRADGGSVAGVTVRLSMALSFNSDVLETNVTTNAAGQFQFTDLDTTSFVGPAAVYALRVLGTSAVPMVIDGADLESGSALQVILRPDMTTVDLGSVNVRVASGIRTTINIPQLKVGMNNDVQVMAFSVDTGRSVLMTTIPTNSGGTSYPLEVTGLPVGRYKFKVYGYGLRPMFYKNAWTFDAAQEVTIPEAAWTTLDSIKMSADKPSIVGLSPVRVFDTRGSKPQGAVVVPKKRVEPSSPLKVKVTGKAGVPSSAVGAVVLTVAAVTPSNAGYVTVYPCGSRPDASSLNFVKSQTIANTVIAPVSASGEVCFYSYASTDMIADVTGYVNAGMGFDTVTPTRLVDTRSGRPQGTSAVTKTKVAPGATKAISAQPLPGGRNAEQVSVNVTATGSNASGYVQVYPCENVAGTTESSTLNFDAGQTIANAAIISASSDRICIASNVAVDVIIDLNGYLYEGAFDAQSLRMYDTRPGKGGDGPISGPKVLRLADLHSELGLNVWNIVATDVKNDGYLTVYPCDQPRPTTSSINYQKGKTIANMVAAQSDGTVDTCVYSSASANVVVDYLGKVFDVSWIWQEPEATPATYLVSVASNGAPANGSSMYASVSEDGRFVTFESSASNLVSGDTNDSSDVFVRDRQSGVTERVSVASNGAQGNSDSYSASISGDGRFVTFESSASNLVSGDTNDSSDVFVRDRQSGVTERVSLASNGAQGNNGSSTGTLSDDGRFVAFLSSASNLVSGDTNDSSDVFVRDRQSGVTERASVTSNGAQANGWSEGLMSDGRSHKPSISGDGRLVIFLSSASNLVSGDTNDSSDVFVRDRQSGVTERVSVASNGAQGNSGSDSASISGDGRFVTFVSSASNLVSGDTNDWGDVFVRDRQSGVTERVSVASNGAQSNSDSIFPSISRDGRFVAFTSIASNLVSGDTNNEWDEFVHDRQTGATERISIAANGAQIRGSFGSSISGDGRFVAIETDAPNLVPGDTNDSWDIFVRDRGA